MREEIATFLANDVKDPRIMGLVTVTAVEVTRDLRHAKVFVSVLGSDSQIEQLLAQVRRELPADAGDPPPPARDEAVDD